jgi:hypothetical protein
MGSTIQPTYAGLYASELTHCLADILLREEFTPLHYACIGICRGYSKLDRGGCRLQKTWQENFVSVQNTWRNQFGSMWGLLHILQDHQTVI